MKIPLNVNRNGDQSAREADLKTLERDILAMRKGDWDAKNSLIRSFMPLISSLAQKRSSEPAKINRLVDAGKEGLLMAAKKFRATQGADQFQIFALDFIERRMDGPENGGGFFARLFGR